MVMGKICNKYFFKVNGDAEESHENVSQVIFKLSKKLNLYPCDTNVIGLNRKRDHI